MGKVRNIWEGTTKSWYLGADDIIKMKIKQTECLDVDWTSLALEKD